MPNIMIGPQKPGLFFLFIYFSVLLILFETKEDTRQTIIDNVNVCSISIYCFDIFIEVAIRLITCALILI